MKPKVLILGLTAALLASAADGVRADEQAALERAVLDLDAAGRRPRDPVRVFERVSGETGVPMSTLEHQQARSRLGFGGLFIANTLAKASGKTFDQITAEHKTGKGWGEIAKENHLKLGPLVSAARKSQRASIVRKYRKEEHSDDHGNSHHEERTSPPPRLEHGAGTPHGHGGK